jgi:phage terminase small subunit
MPKRAHTPETATKDGAATPAPLPSPRKKKVKKRTAKKTKGARRGPKPPAPAPNAPSALPPLRGKQQRFVDEYLVDLNATQAAIRAGYSEKTAYAIGVENLRKPQIRDAVDAAMRARAERVQLTADDVLRELAIIGLSDVRDFTLTSTGDLTLRPGARDSAWRAVSSVKHRMIEIPQGADKPPVVKREVELRLWDKNTALSNVGRHLKLFPNRHEITGKDGGPIEQKVTGTGPNVEAIALKLQGFIDRHESVIAAPSTDAKSPAAE